MSIMIQCLGCKEKYTLGNEHGGKSLSCKCGQKLSIPGPAEDGSDIKECPSCKNVGAPERVLCVECGYNFQTGRKVSAPSAVEEEPVDDGTSPMEKIMAIVKFVVVPAVILVVVAVIYFSMTGKNYGISGSAPLGKLAKYESELTGVGLVKEADGKPIPKGFGVEGKIITFTDEKLKKSSRFGPTETISFLVDAQGKVVGITAIFFAPGVGVPTPGSKICMRIKGLWINDMGFPKAEFTTTEIKVGGYSIYEDIATADNGKVCAKWTREANSGALAMTSDRVFFALKDYKLESLEESDLESFLPEKGGKLVPKLPDTK